MFVNVVEFDQEPAQIGETTIISLSEQSHCQGLVTSSNWTWCEFALQEVRNSKKSAKLGLGAYS